MWEIRKAADDTNKEGMDFFEDLSMVMDILIFSSVARVFVPGFCRSLFGA